MIRETEVRISSRKEQDNATSSKNRRAGKMSVQTSDDYRGPTDDRRLRWAVEACCGHSVTWGDEVKSGEGSLDSIDDS